MNKKQFLLNVLSFLCIAPLYCVVKRPQRITLTTSVTIPCHHKHAIYLYNLLTSFTQQSALPDEIIISLSGARDIPEEIVQKIRNETWPFKVQLIVSDGPKNEAQNRNIACRNATQDIVICQDADDLPHPQRIEIIKFFFETYKIVHLIHGMVNYIDNFKPCANFEDIKWIHVPTVGTIFNKNLRVANGPVALDRSISKKVTWDESRTLGVDLRFNNKVYSRYKETIVVLADIYSYNWSSSTYRHRR